jgi:hypothetical protein
MSLFSFAGDITQKGYEKKRTRLLAPYVPKQAQGMTAVFRSDYVSFNNNQLRNLISEVFHNIISLLLRVIFSDIILIGRILI